MAVHSANKIIGLRQKWRNPFPFPFPVSGIGSQAALEPAQDFGCRRESVRVKTRTGLHGPFFLRIDKMPALFSLAEAVSPTAVSRVIA